MNITIFPTGTGDAASAVKYLLSDTDHEKKKRSVQPEILFGDTESFQAIANSTSRKHKYTSGVIALRDNESLTPDQINTVIEAFRSTFLPGLKVDENFADFWVMHREKGNVELHFLVANTEIKSGTRLNIHPPGERNLQFFNTFVSVMNDTLGFAQVVPDPLKISLKPFEAKSPNGKKDKKAKTDLAKTLHTEITGGFVADRNQLIGYLKKHGVEVPKIGTDFITVRLPGAGKNTRLKGPLFTKGADYKALVAQHHAAQTPKFLTPAEARSQQSKLLAHIRTRADFNHSLYFKPKPGAKRSRAKPFGPSQQKAQNIGAPSPEAAPKHEARSTLEQHLDTLKSEAAPSLARNLGTPTPESRPARDDSMADLPPSLLSGAALGSLDAQIGDLSLQYHTLLLQMVSATGRRAATLKSQLAAIEQRLVALNLELEKKKAQQAQEHKLRIQ